MSSSSPSNQTPAGLHGSLEVVPPFLQKPQIAVSPPTPKTPTYIKVNKIILVLNSPEPLKSTLQITSIAQQRIGFRVLSNASTKYVISPCSGFLLPGESKKIDVSLLDRKKFSSRQRFIIQAKPVVETENDRKRAWSWKIACDPTMIQNIRMRTIRQPGASPSSSNKSLKRFASESSSSCCSVVTAQDGSSSGLATSPVSPTQKTQKGQSSETTVAAHGESDPEIVKMTEKVKLVVEQKKKQAKDMVMLINEVKQLEVELDRLTSQCAEHHGRLSVLNAANVGLRTQGMIIGEQAKAYRNAAAYETRKM